MIHPRPWHAVAALLALCLVGVVAWRLFSPKQGEAEAPAASALVTAAKVRAATVRETVSAYGVIAGSASGTRIVAAPRGLVVTRLLVGPGQPVAAGTPLIVVANTPATQLAFAQATDAVGFAQRDLARVQRLFDQHLAADDQLSAARKTLADARAAVAAQAAAGAGAQSQTLTAPLAGVVATVPVALGEHVAADAPLLTLVAAGTMVAQLGVEPTHARRLAPGQAVSIRSALDPSVGADSRISVVGRQVDPTTRLITVTAPASAPGLPIGTSVQGAITVAGHPGLLVPRRAVVFDESGAKLFIISGGKAHQVAVTAGLEQGDDIEVTGALAAGNLVAVDGAYQLHDGSAVRTSRP